MVGALLMLKLLHCRRQYQIREENPSDPQFMKRFTETPFHICRVCLKEGKVPIFYDVRTKDVAESLYMFGGIQVKENDYFPKYLCDSCYNFIQGAVAFRKTAQDTAKRLSNLSFNGSPEPSNSSHSSTEVAPPPPPIAPSEIKQIDETEQTFVKEDSPIDYDDGDGDGDCDDDDYIVKKEKNCHCKQCDIYFNTMKDLYAHRLSEEHQNRRIKCPTCNKSYTVLYYKKHLALHQPMCPFVCDICGKKFLGQGQFSRHHMTHFNKFPYKCDFCPYRGRFSESLKLHKRIHTGEKPYQCSECAACFVSKSNLNKHMNTHKIEHDYKCELCGRGFYTKRNMDLHLKVDHVGIKDHVCNICGKAFGYRKQMMKHQLKVHKRQKFRSGRMPLYLQAQKEGENVET